jgi:hypothetical protein
MASPLRELAAIFGIEVDTEQLEGADKSIEAFIEKLKKFAAGAFWVEAAKKTAEFFEGQLEGATKLQNQAERLDVSVGQLKAFGFAAAAAGLDADSAVGMLTRFERATSGAGKHGAQAAGELQKLGIHLKDSAGGSKNTVDTMLDLADAFQKMPDRAHKTQAAIALFGRQGLSMIPVLEKGRAAMEELFKESEELGSGLGPEFYKNAKEVTEQFEHMEFGIKSLKERALAAALPYLDKLAHILKDTVKDVIEFTKKTNVLQTGLIAIATIIGIGLIGAVTGLLAALAPFAIPVAIIGALYLAFDDVYTLMTGGESVIGDTLDALFGIGTAQKFAEGLSDAMSALFAILSDDAELIKDVLLIPLEGAFDVAKALGKVIGDLAGGNFSEALKDVKAGAAEWFADEKKNVLGAGGAVKHIFTEDFTKKGRENKRIRKVQESAEGRALAASGVPLNAITEAGTGTRQPAEVKGGHLPIPGREGKGGSSGSTTTVHQTKVDVHVATKDDPQSVGKAAAGGVEQGVKRANYNAQKAANVP